MKPLLVQQGQPTNDVVLGAVGNQSLHQLCTRGHVATSIHITIDSLRTDAKQAIKLYLAKLRFVVDKPRNTDACGRKQHGKASSELQS